MTPTMSEYFEAWKNSRFIAGEDATELGFVAASRLSDIADILEGIQFTYDEIEPMIAEEDPAQAEQTGNALEELLAYVEELRDREAAGKEYTAEEADTLGSEAQRQAEAIAGQVTQAAQRLGIELQDARRRWRDCGGMAKALAAIRPRSTASPRWRCRPVPAAAAEPPPWKARRADPLGALRGADRSAARRVAGRVGRRRRATRSGRLARA